MPKPTFKKPHKETCSREGCIRHLESDREKKQRYCDECHAAYMREWRRSNTFTRNRLKEIFNQFDSVGEIKEYLQL